MKIMPQRAIQEALHLHHASQVCHECARRADPLLFIGTDAWLCGECLMRACAEFAHYTDEQMRVEHASRD